jgi:hypothetical protein
MTFIILFTFLILTSLGLFYFSTKMIEEKNKLLSKIKNKAAEQNAIAIKTLADTEAYRVIAEATSVAEGNTKMAKSVTKFLKTSRQMTLLHCQFITLTNNKISACVSTPT